MNRNKWEKSLIHKMIFLYCREHHGDTKKLCPKCEAILQYAYIRIEKCKFGYDKPVCSSCTVHCYNKIFREKVKKIMKWSGPRMIKYYPLDTIRYMVYKSTHRNRKN